MEKTTKAWAIINGSIFLEACGTREAALLQKQSYARADDLTVVRCEVSYKIP